MGSKLMLQKRSQEAEALFHKAAALNPKDLEAYRSLGEIYQGLGDNQQAIASYAEVVKLTPADRGANVALATLYQQAGQYGQSVEAAERVPTAARPAELLPVLDRKSGV